MRQEDLANKIEVDKTSVSHWEIGISRPEIARLPALAAALGVTVLELIRGEKVWELYERALEAAA